MMELEYTRELLSNMGLVSAATLLDARLETAAKGELTYLSFLSGLLEAEQ